MYMQSLVSVHLSVSVYLDRAQNSILSSERNKE